MTTLTNKQRRAIRAYLFAWNKYEKVRAIQAGQNVDTAAWELAHDAAGEVAAAFGVKTTAPVEAVLELLCSAETLPHDVASVATVVREVASAGKSIRRWTQWCERHPETITAKERLHACSQKAA